MPPRPARRLAWIVTAAMFLTLGGFGVSAVNAPLAYAATSWYQHGYSSNTIGNATVALVTSASQTETAAATTLTTTISSSAGDLLLVVVAIPNTTVSLSSVTDSAGNLYQAGSGRNGTASQLLLRVAIHATAVTSVTANFSASTLAVMYVLELSGVNTATPQGTFGANNTSSASPSSTTAVSPNATGAVAIGLIQSPAAVTYSAAPSFTTGTTNNLATIESTGGGSTEDLIIGWDLPGSTATQIYSGTYSASNEWSAELVFFEPAGNTLDNTAGSNPRGTMGLTFTNGIQEVWETGYTVATQTVAAGTYTFTYWTTACSGTCTVTATLTFGYSTTATCNSITALASWSASIVKGTSGGTTSTTTGSSATIPANSYLCWQIAVTATSGGGYSLEYDTSAFPTRIDTPTITAPEFGLALLGLALVVPLAARRRLRDWLPFQSRSATRP